MLSMSFCNPGRLRLLASMVLAVAMLLAGCVIGGKDEPHKGSEVENEILGATIYLVDGKPAVNATIRVYPVDHNPQFVVAKPSAIQALVYSTRTDSKGHYKIDSLPRGEYNILSDLNGEVAYQDSVFLSASSRALQSDTLRDPGSVTGRVILQPNDNPRSVTVQILGTNTFVNVEESGYFTLDGLAAGNYRARLITTLENYTATFANIRVRSGKDDSLVAPIVLTYTGIPVVENIRVAVDTLAGLVKLSWKPVVYSSFLEYLVFRNPANSLTPYILPIAKLRDTFFVDTLYRGAFGPEFFDSGDFDYEVVVRNRSKEIGKTDGSIRASTLSPTAVTTFMKMSLVNAQSGEASIGDTVGVYFTYQNLLRRHISVKWFVDGNPTPTQVRPAPYKSGGDTLWFSTKEVSLHTFRAEIEDEVGQMWTASQTLSVVQDVPMVFPGSKTLACRFLGDTLRLDGRTRDKFGSIVKWEWDIGGVGNFFASSGSDTNLILTKLGKTISVLRVTDDDGNQAQDTVWAQVFPNLDFVTVPAGVFENRIQVTVTVNSFRIMSTEVTQGQYFAMMREAPFLKDTSSLKLPMILISIVGVKQFCNKLSVKFGYQPAYLDDGYGDKFNNMNSGFRMPFEDEWEYAARAGYVGKFWEPTHPDSIDKHSWWKNNSDGKIHAPRLKTPNSFGIFDMGGNVSELVHNHPRFGMDNSNYWSSQLFGMGTNYSEDYADPDYHWKLNDASSHLTGFRVMSPWTK